ncbi:hypothetical protein [Nocardia tengchongensis]|uniref:hypothetical protein n=1 Tax=Nocardia tengchongensis TaxID=2055889 RepID=UPI0036819964
MSVQRRMIRGSPFLPVEVSRRRPNPRPNPNLDTALDPAGFPQTSVFGEPFISQWNRHRLMNVSSEHSVWLV